MIGVAPPQIMIPYTSDNTRYVMVYSGGGNKYVIRMVLNQILMQQIIMQIM